MRYALNIAEDGRILSATFEEYATEDMALVDALPEGDISDYLYQDGEYVYDPLSVPTMTEEEARTERDRLLAETDWTQTLDAPLSDEMKEAFRVYRQALRDIPQQENFPAEIIWPTKPETV